MISYKIAGGWRMGGGGKGGSGGFRECSKGYSYMSSSIFQASFMTQKERDYLQPEAQNIFLGLEDV